VARRSAVDQRADTQRQIKALIVTAPDDLRARLRGLSLTKLIAACAGLRPDRADTATPATAAKIALRSLARRHQQLAEEIADLDELLEPLVTAINPGLLAAHGVGADTAGQLLVTAGENHDRLTNEARFAMLCGTAPIPASSGKTTRHRLNRGGDRQANAALYRVVLCRLRWDPRTRDYMQRRTKEGMSKKEIIRCLKRYIARELYQLITSNDLQLAT
jgi:transposase